MLRLHHCPPAIEFIEVTWLEHLIISTYMNSSDCCVVFEELYIELFETRKLLSTAESPER